MELIQTIRYKQPRIGSRTLFFLLYDDLQRVGKIGRDKFISILRNNNQLVVPKKSYTRTTNSFHRFYKYNNLLYNKTTVSYTHLDVYKRQTTKILTLTLTEKF